MITPNTEKSAAEQAAEDANMEKYGITRQPADYYVFREYRYSNLKDAVAQAKRQKPDG